MWCNKCSSYEDQRTHTPELCALSQLAEKTGEEAKSKAIAIFWKNEVIKTLADKKIVECQLVDACTRISELEGGIHDADARLGDHP